MRARPATIHRDLTMIMGLLWSCVFTACVPGLTLVADEPGTAAESAPVPADGTQTGEAADTAKLRELLDRLADGRFTVRQAATAELGLVSTEALVQLLPLAEARPDGEAIRRIFDVLERDYLSVDSARVRVVSELIEQAATSGRWMVAEQATDILDRHWQQRVLLAVQELHTMGLTCSPSDPAVLWDPGVLDRRQTMFGPALGGSDLLQLNVTRDWTGQQRGMELLKRVAVLSKGSLPRGRVPVGVFLIDGHPLTAEESGQLRAAFGDLGVVERGRVCLGIKNSVFPGDEEGCRVGEVKPGTSAADSGIQQDDLILQLDGRKVTSFDDLVSSLRAYDVGDTVTMTVEREKGRVDRDRMALPGIYGRRGPTETVEVRVLLKGWTEDEPAAPGATDQP